MPLANRPCTLSSSPSAPPPAQVSGYDRQGMLHSLSHALWESDTTVFKAHITTSPAGKVSDMFWMVSRAVES